MIDLHCHVLAGLDDGPKDMVASLDMCRSARADGVTVLVASPHQCNGVYNVSNEAIHTGVAALRKELEQAGIDVTVMPGGDVHIEVDTDLAGLAERAMTVADHGRHMLVEPSALAVPGIIRGCLASLRQQGITPILTHPERNLNVQMCPGLLDPLVEDGCLVQVTAASLTGEFGDSARKCATELLCRRSAHIVASDAHSATWRPSRMTAARAAAAEFLTPPQIAWVFGELPRRILAGETVVAPRPKRRRRRWFSFPWTRP